jgi:hypothetical protein
MEKKHMESMRINNKILKHTLLVIAITSSSIGYAGTAIENKLNPALKKYVQDQITTATNRFVPISGFAEAVISGTGLTGSTTPFTIGVGGDPGTQVTIPLSNTVLGSTSLLSVATNTITFATAGTYLIKIDSVAMACETPIMATSSTDIFEASVYMTHVVLSPSTTTNYFLAGTSLPITFTSVFAGGSLTAAGALSGSLKITVAASDTLTFSAVNAPQSDSSNLTSQLSTTAATSIGASVSGLNGCAGPNGNTGLTDPQTIITVTLIVP